MAAVIVDLFAGPGGWDVGALRLGLDVLGVEWDDDACSTRRAAGLRTVHGDVAALEPRQVAPEGASGLIVQGDSRLWPPGHKVNADDRARLGEEEANERYGDRAGTDAIRLTVADALALQSFPEGYPVQGTKTAQFRQVGDAVPPLLAYHILRAVVGA